MGGLRDLNTLNILVVDDDRFMVEAVSIALRDLGVASIETATEGAAALDRLLASSFDLLICDLNMPGMDGLGLLGHVASLPVRPAIVLFSGEDPRILEAARQFAEAKSLTILGTASKPMTRQALEGLLRNDGPPVRQFEHNARVPLERGHIGAGLRTGTVALAYQPKCSLADGSVAGAEALLRWRDPELGNVPPQDIVRAAERHGLIDELTLAVLAIATRDRARLLQAGIDMHIACNVSMHNLYHAAIVERMHAVVAEAGDRPDRYTLEVTETHLIDDLPSVLEALIRLRFQGFGLAIDDYGTGAASMQFLMQLPSTEVKIDRTFVVNAARSEAGRALLQSAIDIGLALDQDVVAEGVETEQDDRLLRTMGCRFAQGYFYARPMPLEALAEWVPRHRPPSRPGHARPG